MWNLTVQMLISSFLLSEGRGLFPSKNARNNERLVKFGKGVLYKSNRNLNSRSLIKALRGGDTSGSDNEDDEQKESALNSHNSESDEQKVESDEPQIGDISEPAQNYNQPNDDSGTNSDPALNHDQSNTHDGTFSDPALNHDQSNSTNGNISHSAVNHDQLNTHDGTNSDPAVNHNLNNSEFDEQSKEAETSLLMDSNVASNLSDELGLKGKLISLLPTNIERKKLIPLGLMFFSILFCYTILRDTKDVLVVTAPGGNAELIPFLKTYVNLPGAVLFTIIYAKINNKFSPQKVFYITILPFLAFFFSFGAVIYPNRDNLHPNSAADYLLSVLPKAFFPLVSIFRNWTYSLFYTMAELWGSVVVSVLFWGFANEITTSKEAKKYYPLFGLGANVALIFSGQYVKFVSKVRAGLPDGVDKWGRSLQMLMAAVCFFGSFVVGLYAYMQNVILNDPDVKADLPSTSGASKKRAATSMGLVESAKYLASSSYIRNLALLVISYGMSINIVEVTWKSKLKAAYPDPNDYSAFMGNFSTATGSITLLMMILGRFIFTKFGWGVAAQITPTVLLITAGVFFSLILFGQMWNPLLVKFGTTPLAAAVLVGAAQNILSKSAKYSLFDPCKEMAYINLDSEQKTKGKAAIDVIGNPLGKSGGSFIQQILIVTMGSLSASTPYLAGILFAIITMWINAASRLNSLIKRKDMDLATSSSVKE